MRLVVALAELAIGFTVSVLAQQKDTADRQIVQQRDLLGVAKALEEFGELSLKVDEAYNKNDESRNPLLGRHKRLFGLTPADKEWGRWILT